MYFVWWLWVDEFLKMERSKQVIKGYHFIISNKQVMLLSGVKQSMGQKKRSVGQFDNFLKIRSEKQSIIESQSQSIHEKVNGFQSLLKLTKTGTSINNSGLPTGGILKRNPTHKNNINKSESSKTFNHFTTMTSHTHNNDEAHQSPHEHYHRFDEACQETNENQFKKLNKMVAGMTQYEQDKDSFHHNHYQAAVKARARASKTSQLEKRNYKKNNQPTMPRVNSSLEQTASKQKYSCFTDEKRNRKFYPPHEASDARLQIQRLNQKFNKHTSSKQLNYPKVLLKNSLLQNQDNFTNLRKKIKLLENKAKKQYGLKFETNQSQNRPKNDHNNFLIIDNQGVNQQSSLSWKENDEEMELEFSRLSIAPILAQQLPKPRKQYEQLLRNQHILGGDSSVPKGLIQIVEKKDKMSLGREKSGTFMTQGHYASKKRSSLCSGAWRQKSFAPSYTYICI